MRDSARPGLEERLADLRTAVEFPATPDLGGAVGRRLRLGAAGGRGVRLRLVRPRVLAIAVLVLIVAAASALAASPPLREAILELVGVRVERVPELPPAPTDARPTLGERTTIGAAERQAGFDLVRLRRGAPERVYVRELDGTAVVTFAYRDERVLLSQFRARVDRTFLKKLLADTRVEEVRVGGEPGYRLSGGEHVVQYRNGGRTVEERLAGDVLLWQRGGVALRLEGELSKRRALALARSVR
jgi:hypothetical protein